MPLRYIQNNDPEWWRFWSEELTTPVEADISFQILRMTEVNETSQSFNAKVRIDVTVEGVVGSSGFKPERLETSDGSVLYGVMVPGSEKAYIEWAPKLIFVNLKKAEYISKWTTRQSTLTCFHVEIQGLFGDGFHTRWAPMDQQWLRINVTSDWDINRLVLKQSNSSQIDREQCFELTQSFEVAPNVGVELTENVSRTQKHYANATAAIFIRRYPIGQFFMQMFRPFFVCALSFSVFCMPPSTAEENTQLLSNRLSIVMILLLTNAVEPKRWGAVFTYIDVYVMFCFFVMAAICIETAVVFGIIEETRGVIVDYHLLNILAITFGTTTSLVLMMFFHQFLVVKQNMRDWKRGMYDLRWGRCFGNPRDAVFVPTRQVSSKYGPVVVNAAP